MKKCSKCKEVKPFEEFSRSGSRKDGYQAVCKLCTREYRQTEKGKASIKKYNQSEKGKASIKKYYQSEKGKASIKKRNQTENRKASLKKYNQSEKGKLVNKRVRHKRRAAMNDTGTFSAEEWNDRLEEYNYCCAYCYKPFTKEKLEIDHMLPVSRGGTNTIDNLVPACRSCNARKKDMTPLEMLQKGFM